MLSLFIWRSSTFHNFVKIALTKNPKKRPTAERLLTVSHWNYRNYQEIIVMQAIRYVTRKRYFKLLNMKIWMIFPDMSCHTVPVRATQFCPCSTKTKRQHTWKGIIFIPSKILFTKGSRITTLGCSLLTLPSGRFLKILLWLKNNCFSWLLMQIYWMLYVYKVFL